MVGLSLPDFDVSRRREIAARLRGAVLHESGEVVLMNSGDVEAVLRQQRHVLMTVDGCGSTAQLERLCRTAEENGVRFAPVNPDRHLPSRRLIEQLLDAGKLGAPGLVRLHRWEAGESRMMLRDLDLVLWLFGTFPDHVHARRQADAGVLIHLGFPGGGMALIDEFHRLPPGEGHRSLTLVGAAGAAHADDHANVNLLHRGGRPEAVLADEGIVPQAAMIQEFIDALASGSDMSEHQAACRRALALADAVETSLRDRRVVEERYLP